MAVQAQYPSNVLLLNRNGQEMKNNNLGNHHEYSSSLQTQQGVGGLLDHQSQMFFNANTTTNTNNGVLGLNPRKRTRETAINLFSLQPQQSPPPTLINLSQLHNQQQQQQQQQPNLVSTGLRLAFCETQQQQQQSSTLSSILSEDLTTHIKQQRDEIDQFLQIQGDQLRRTLAERRQTHYRALLGVAEENATRRLREKEVEVEKARTRNAELEQRVAQLRVEAQVWQNKARTQEATAASLQVQLQYALSAQDKREEGVGCSGLGGGGEAEDAESAHIDPERVVEMSSTGPSCKACRGRVATVVLLPCRHLCLCTNCNTAVDTCPICLSYRSASVEVYLT